ncbi:hypothetical protein ACQZV8_07570 [Magnetococcales bacterium HHB-1]
MKANRLLAIFLVTLIYTQTAFASSLGGVGSEAMGRKRAQFGGGASEGMTSYDATKIMRIQGTVQSSQVNHNPHMSEEGLHVMLETPQGIFKVHVCPNWYAQKIGLQFQNREKLFVQGATFTRHGDQNIYAATIRRHRRDLKAKQRLLRLRNLKTGAPLWWGRYQQQNQKEMRQQIQEKIRQRMQMNQ